MAHKTIPLPDADEVRILFGPKDRHLRLIRRTFEIDLFLRGGELHFDGSREGIDSALRVVEELRGRISEHGTLSSFDVSAALERAPGGPAGKAATIELFERSKVITARTAGQANYVEEMRKNDLVFCLGPAGSGKTFLAVAMAIHILRREDVRKIVLARPAVEAGEKLGFLPGDMLEKVNPFLRPLLDAIEELLGGESAERYKDRDVIEVVPLAFMRGRTLNDTFIILDEAQNTTVTQMKMLLTRMGVGSKIVVTGDPTQNDLPPGTRSGLQDAVDRLAGINGVGAVTLKSTDIVRHPLVKDIVRAYDAQRGGFEPRVVGSGEGDQG